MNKSVLIHPDGHRIAPAITTFLLACFLLSQAGLTGSQAAPATINYSVAISSEPATLDAADTPMYSQDLLVYNQIYDTLVRFDPGKTNVLPSLASSWTTSSDGLTWTFTLRTGVTFHDGKALDATAVLFNFERWWDSTNPYHDGSFEVFATFLGFKDDAATPNLIASLSAPNATQFVITLKSPAPLLTFLAYPALGIASPAAIQAGTIDSLPVGSGPFKFNSWVHGDHIKLDRYSGYWGKKAVADSLTFKIIAASSDQLSALQAGTVQSASNIGLDSLAAVLADPGLQAFWRPASSVSYIGINRSKTPLDNPLVRQAIAHAINKKSLIANYFAPGTQVAAQLLPDDFWGFDSTINDYDYNPALAISLLSQAGYSSGFSISLAYRTTVRDYLPNPAQTAAAIKADLAAVGITANLDEYTNSSLFLNKVNAGDFELFLLGWGADYLHPYDFFEPILCVYETLAYGPTDTELCAKVTEGLFLPTDAQRVDAYKWVAQRVHDTLPLIPLSYPRSLLVTRRPLSGLIPAPLSLENYQPVFTATSWNFFPAIVK